MEQFATADQMANRSQGAIPADHPFLDDELLAASRLIRNYCRWHIATEETGLTYTHRSRFREEVWLPALQVNVIEAVTVNGNDLTDLAAIDFDAATGWTSLSGTVVTVKYSAGFQDIPEDLTTLTLQIAARALGSPLGLVREGAGGVNVTHTQVASGIAGGAVLLPHEMAQLDAYKIGWIR